VLLPHVLCVVQYEHQGLISQQHIKVLHTRTRAVSLQGAQGVGVGGWVGGGVGGVGWGGGRNRGCRSVGRG